ncbi:MAG: sodium ion-translocating decarboxylase subunit beta [Parabacteroides merdae]
MNSIKIFGLGALSFVIATCAGILFVKFFNLFLKEGNKINPLIGNSGVSAVPDSARISQNVGLEYDPTNYLLMHAMGPNVAGVIGSAVAAGILLGFSRDNSLILHKKELNSKSSPNIKTYPSLRTLTYSW